MCDERYSDSNAGWIKLYRKIFNNPLYFTEPFTRSSAWIDLILLANHKENYIIKRGIKVPVKRGQIGFGIDTLAKRWKWSRGKVERFLKLLENEEQIVRQNDNVTSLISILNYDEYQSNDKANEIPNDDANECANDTANDNTNDEANSKPNGHQTVNQTDTNKNDKNIKKKRIKEIIHPKNEFSGDNGENTPILSSRNYLSQLEKAFSEEYKKSRGFEYESATKGKDSNAFGMIAKKYKEKYPVHNTEQAVQGLRSFFQKCMTIDDKYIRENMSPMLIVSQMPKINSILNNKNGVSNGEPTPEQREEILSRFV